jgi:hypothetical protein
MAGNIIISAKQRKRNLIEGSASAAASSVWSDSAETIAGANRPDLSEQMSSVCLGPVTLLWK